jgi:hypothetical protein
MLDEVNRKVTKENSNWYKHEHSKEVNQLAVCKTRTCFTINESDASSWQLLQVTN